LTDKSLQIKIKGTLTPIIINLLILILRERGSFSYQKFTKCRKLKSETPFIINGLIHPAVDYLRKIYLVNVWCVPKLKNKGRGGDRGEAN